MRCYLGVVKLKECRLQLSWWAADKQEKGHGHCKALPHWVEAQLGDYPVLDLSLNLWVSPSSSVKGGRLCRRGSFAWEWNKTLPVKDNASSTLASQFLHLLIRTSVSLHWIWAAPALDTPLICYHQRGHLIRNLIWNTSFSRHSSNSSGLLRALATMILQLVQDLPSTWSLSWMRETKWTSASMLVPPLSTFMKQAEHCSKNVNQITFFPAFEAV